MTRRFCVCNAHHIVAIEGDARETAKRTLAPPRIVPQMPVFELATCSPDRQLVAHTERLVPPSEVTGSSQGCEHARRKFRIRLTPGRPERVDQVAPMSGPAKRSIADAEGESLENVRR